MARSHEYFMEMALEETQKAVAEGNDPYGCVIVRGDTVVARGHNMVPTTKDVTAHSERVTVQKATQALGNVDLSGCTLYTNWEPCPMCAGAILNANVGTVVIGGRNAEGSYGDYTIERLLELTKQKQRLRLVTDVLRQRCEEQVREVEKKRRR